MLERKPHWLRKKISFGQGIETSNLLKSLNLNTVCRQALCPNISECFHERHAAFLIMGKNCTRSCTFCHVAKDEQPETLDPQEGGRIAKAAQAMGLKHVVITSVTRDDLPDGGASHFSRVVLELRKLPEKVSVEVLTPDFKGDAKAVRTVCKSNPDIFAHNLETVPELYHLRPKADYRRSLEVLRFAKEFKSGIRTKSALLLGLGETKDEVVSVMKDLRNVGCDFLALGQYLRPDKKNAEVKKYLPPEEFQQYLSIGLSLGFLHVESAPYARSSWRASSYLEDQQ